MKFIMSYSGGKDSTLALDRMIREGNTCVGILVLVSKRGKYSYLHIFSRETLDQFSKSLGVPLIPVPSVSLHDSKSVESAIENAKDLYGAEAVCFGDIDAEEARSWNESVAAKLGFKAVFPLWKEDRRRLLDEFFDRGYTCLFKTIDNTLLPEELLGKPLTRECIPLFEENGVDICGENGEYHTIVTDGPVFKKPVEFRYNRLFRKGVYSSLIIDDTYTE